jgi:precorrin-6Y C5,15-methyltransferase (decarboxylating)
MTVTIIGWLPGEPLLAAAQAALANATQIYAAKGFGALAARLAPMARFDPFESILDELPTLCAQAVAAGERVVVAMSGDPLFHGAAQRLIEQLGTCAVTIIPERTTIQIACARLGVAWHDGALVSAHGRVTAPWSFANAPRHPLRPILAAAGLGRTPILALTAPGAGAQEIAQTLLTLGYPATAEAAHEAPCYQVAVAARLGYPDERLWSGMTLEEAAATPFPHPHVMLLTKVAEPTQPLPHYHLPDNWYQQRQPEKGLITKQEVRALTLALLAVRPNDCLWDIGAGSGSVGLEAARLAGDGEVWAFEKNAEDVAIATANARRLRTWNWTIRHTRAPAGLDDAPDPDALFIGGSGGELSELLTYCWQRLKPGGRLVANFVTLENLATATATLARCAAPWQVTQLWTARSKPILSMHRLASENPIWLVSATKPTVEKKATALPSCEKTR